MASRPTSAWPARSFVWARQLTLAGLTLGNLRVAYVDRCRRLGAVKIRTNISAASSARSANEPRLEIRQPHIVGPAIGIQRQVVATPVVRAIDEDVSHAHFAHLSECDLLSSHATIKAALHVPRKSSIPSGTERAEATACRGCGEAVAFAFQSSADKRRPSQGELRQSRRRCPQSFDGRLRRFDSDRECDDGDGN